MMRRGHWVCRRYLRRDGFREALHPLSVVAKIKTAPAQDNLADPKPSSSGVKAQRTESRRLQTWDVTL